MRRLGIAYESIAQEEHPSDDTTVISSSPKRPKRLSFAQLATTARLFASSRWRRLTVVAGFLSTSFALIVIGLNATVFGSDAWDNVIAAASSPPESYPWHLPLPLPPTDENNGTGLDYVQPLLSSVRDLFAIDDAPGYYVPYIIRNGTLLSRTSQHEALVDDHWYVGRIGPSEEVMHAALEIGKRVSQHVAGAPPRVSELVKEGVPLILYWGDYCGCGPGCWGYHVHPKFAYAMESPSKSGGNNCTTLAFPGYVQWKRHGHRSMPEDWDETLTSQDAEYPWSEKLQKAGWRGSTTGIGSIRRRGYGTWRDAPRFRLVRYGVDRPDIIDAGFTNIVKVNDTERKEIMAESRVVPSIEFRDFMKYKAVLDIDGNSWSSRFGDLLCMNSVVIKVEPEYTDYFWKELQPWTHYVPVHGNMSNLVENVEYVLDGGNVAQMRNIVRSANDWCRSKMTSTQMAIDMLWILVSYLELLHQGDANWRDKWQNDPVASGNVFDMTAVGR